MSFYLMHRGWMDNPAFKKEPFTDREAWEWLIQEASFEPQKRLHKGKMIEVARGKVPTSYRDLKAKFQWGNERLRRYILRLESEQMITIETGTGFLIITVCNYDKYQVRQEKSGTQTGTVTGTPSGTQTGTHIKIKELKELKRTVDDDMRVRIEKIFSWCEDFINSPLPLITAPVVAWVCWGVDLELDVQPVARRWKEKNPEKAMKSLGWLDDDIASSIIQRNKPMPEVAAKPVFQKYSNSNDGSAEFEATLKRMQQGATA